MSKKELFEKVYKEAGCPKNLAEQAAQIADKYYPNNKLIGASDEEIATIRQAKQYLKDKES